MEAKEFSYEKALLFFRQVQVRRPFRRSTGYRHRNRLRIPEHQPCQIRRLGPDYGLHSPRRNLRD